MGMVRILLVLWNSFQPPLQKGMELDLGNVTQREGRGRIFSPRLKLVPALCLGKLNFSIFWVCWVLFFSGLLYLSQPDTSSCQKFAEREIRVL